jgi:ATP-binding cassette subfamily F protein 3
LDEVKSVALSNSESEIRKALGQFLFRGDTVYKSISVLSGGERSRVALAKFLLKPSNVLLLDEPTNHLDVMTRKMLIEALSKYEGTIVCASHDSLLMHEVATRVIQVEDGECVELSHF